jgi:CRP-like cAMP-binding protein
METIIEVDNYYKFPVDKRKWEVRKKTRRIQYKIQELNKGAIFGHEEMLGNFNRRCRVRAVTNCSLIYINKNELMQTFPPEQIEKLKGMMRNLDLD